VTLHDFGVRHSAVNTVAAGARVPPRERRRLRSRSHPVRCTTLDAFSDRTGLVPDVVKLDIEGAELAAVGGMRRLLEERSPLLSVETGDYAGMASPRTAEVIELLERLGYVAHEWDGSSLRRHERRSEYGYGNLFFRRAN
jgi:hypothetical protein